jgi:pimeloyl-ACP methyl ester carboxylesterase
MAAPARTTEFVQLGDCRVALERRGSGPPLLLLAGEEALEADAPFADALAARYELVIPSAPGFGFSNRPDWLTSVDDIAYVYLDLLERLALDRLVVVGCSFGGWIAAEMATKDDARFARLVLIDPYGIKVGGPTERDVADIWLLHPDEVLRRRWHDPAKGKRDFPAMPEDVLRVIAQDRETFARYCWEPYMHDPKLKHRLHRIAVPTLLLWGREDGITSTAYGEAYRALIPGARLDVIPDAGHYPHLEQPDAVVRALNGFLA